MAQCQQEIGCPYYTAKKKYYSFPPGEGRDVPGYGVHIKRNLVQNEWLISRLGNVYKPRLAKERLMNEVAAIAYIRHHTSIPVPTIRCAFEDNGRYYVIQDFVQGTTLEDLPDDNKPGVIEELEHYIQVMHSIKSPTMGGFAGTACLPFRVDYAIGQASPNDVPDFSGAGGYDFVLCHNDIAQQNVIEDEQTLKIKAIIDWEYAGFYPRQFDGAFYRRKGPSVALEGEYEDVPELLKIVEECRRKDSLQN